MSARFDESRMVDGYRFEAANDGESETSGEVAAAAANNDRGSKPSREERKGGRVGTLMTI